MRKTGKRATRSVGGNVVVIICLVIMGVFMALPLYYAIVASLKPYEEIFVFPPKLYVKRPTLDNFISLFTSFSDSLVPFSRYVMNSVLVTGLTTLLGVLSGSMAAYPLAKNPFRGRNFLFNIVVTSLLFVPQVTFVPQYIILARLGWINSSKTLILPAVGSSLGLFLMKQFMEQLPDSMLEAARIDGASEYRICFGVVLPNVKPALLTVILFVFQSAWNNRGQTFIFDEELKLLPVAVSDIVASNGIAYMGMGSAATVHLMLPPIILFILTQRRIVETMAFAGLKD